MLITRRDDDAATRAFTRLTCAGVDLGFGAGYLLGAPALAPTLQLMGDVMPMYAWGALLVAAGITIPLGWIRIAALLGAAVWLCYAVFNIATLASGTATGWVWPAFLGWALLHLGMLWFTTRPRRAPQGAG